MTKIIVVIGMHRSGTSALTGTLVNAGAWFGHPALAAGGRPARPLGLVERKDFLRLTEPALQAVGCSWHDVHGFQPAWEKSYAERVREQFRAGVLADLRCHPVAVLKDPRLCLLLPLFRPVMKSAAALFIVRNPHEVAMSLHARNQFPIGLGAALWEAYNRHALAALQDVPSIMVQHRRLVSRPAQCIPQIVRKLASLGIEGLDADTAVAANSIKSNLYHHHAEQALNKLSAGQREFWKALRQAKVPSDVAAGDLSSETRETLQAHHQERAAV
ncbi:MAG: sulfotransferase [Alphaproteobacteria bacterium]|nr:sulfotransferase [Alphaproteobacteria bacterium]